MCYHICVWEMHYAEWHVTMPCTQWSLFGWQHLFISRLTETLYTALQSTKVLLWDPSWVGTKDRLLRQSPTALSLMLAPRHVTGPPPLPLTISRSRLFLLLRLHRREQKLWERLCSQVQLPYQTAWDFKKCILTVKCNHAYICIKLMNTLRYSFHFLTMLSFC